MLYFLFVDFVVMDRNHLVAIVTVWNTYIQMLVYLLSLIMLLIELEDRDNQRENLGQRTFTRLQVRSTEIQRITRESDVNCINELRMDRNAFAMLCNLLKTRGGLLDDGNMTIDEQVAIFINILAHHTKNRTIQVRFYRSGETISRYVHRVLRAFAILTKIQHSLLKICLSGKITLYRPSSSMLWRQVMNGLSGEMI